MTLTHDRKVTKVQFGLTELWSPLHLYVTPAHRPTLGQLKQQFEDVLATGTIPSWASLDKLLPIFFDRLQQDQKRNTSTEAPCVRIIYLTPNEYMIVNVNSDMDGSGVCVPGLRVQTENPTL